MARKRSYSDIIRSAKLYGHSGYCGIVAVAINEVVFEGKGELVVATNPNVERLRGRPFIGHIAVRYQHRLYDATGFIDYETFREWGMVDPDDPDFSSNPEDPEDPDTVFLTEEQAIDEATVVPLSNYGRDPIKVISKYTGMLDSWDAVGEDVKTCPSMRESIKKLKAAKYG